MQRQSIPTQSRKYPIDSEMIDPVRTNLSVSDLNLFEVFLEANELSGITIGYYTDRDVDLRGYIYTVNNICYSNNNPTYIMECNLMHMNLKYGGLVDAFNDYKIKIGRIR